MSEPLVEYNYIIPPTYQHPEGLAEHLGGHEGETHLDDGALSYLIEKLGIKSMLDIGCGPGYFLDEMKARGYTNVDGINLSPGDIKICEEKGHKIKKYDMSFLPQDE